MHSTGFLRHCEEACLPIFSRQYARHTGQRGIHVNDIVQTLHKVYASRMEFDISGGAVDLILWRHAEAEDSMPDFERKLTPKGRRQAEKTAVFLHQHLPGHARILVSPAVRTQQTATALTSRFTLAPTIAPGASADDVLRAARWPDAGGAVLVVGHQPTLGEVASRLLGCDECSLGIRKSALWWFSRREHEGLGEITLRLVITPDFL